MRKTAFLLTLSLALLAGCVTINVYFPAAAAQKAADKVIGNIIGPDQGPPASAAPASSTQPPSSGSDDSHGAAGGEPLAMRMLDALVPVANAAEAQPDLDIHTPQIDAIMARMRDRYRSTLKPLLDSGAAGFTHNGDIAIHDPAKIPLSSRAQANQAIAAENSDRAELYRQIAVANGHPEWASRMREAFAKRWIAMAHPGWYYQDASGKWGKK
ncbi:MAG TPA: YdbL family protein [Rhodanobacteraceae bacterium]|nr:YdbL family protein [Rhodanobacteraceae bacterium]